MRANQTIYGGRLHAQMSRESASSQAMYGQLGAPGQEPLNLSDGLLHGGPARRPRTTGSGHAGYSVTHF